MRLDRTKGALTYTDDTHMTLGMAESLVERNGFDGDHMARHFAMRFREEPWRGYGSGPPQVFDLIERVVPWDHAARTLFDGAGSFGNGAAMRVAPVALVGFRDVQRAAAVARQSAVITHSHQLGIEGAVLQACAIAQALRSERSRPIDRDTFIDLLGANAGAPVFQEKLQTMRQILSLEDRADPQSVVSLLGNGIASFDSVPTAIYTFLRFSDSFRDVVGYAIRLGGDTDTIASMAGAISGAHLGLDAIPLEWRERIESYERLQTLADALLRQAEEREDRR